MKKQFPPESAKSNLKRRPPRRQNSGQDLGPIFGQDLHGKLNEEIFKKNEKKNEWGWNVGFLMFSVLVYDHHTFFSVLRDTIVS